MASLSAAGCATRGSRPTSRPRARTRSGWPARRSTTRSSSTSCCRASTASRPAGGCATRRRLGAGADADRARRGRGPRRRPRRRRRRLPRQAVLLRASCSRGCGRWRAAGRRAARRAHGRRPARSTPPPARPGAATTRDRPVVEGVRDPRELMRQPGEVLSRFQLLEHAWDYDYENRSNVVDVYVRYLREKIDRPFGDAFDRDGARRGLPAAQDRPGKRAVLIRRRCRSAASVTLAFAGVMAVVLALIGRRPVPALRVRARRDDQPGPARARGRRAPLVQRAAAPRRAGRQRARRPGRELRADPRLDGTVVDASPRLPAGRC